MTWEDLSPPYSTIVVDPPWDQPANFPINAWRRAGDSRKQTTIPYSTMSVEAISSLPVTELAATNSHLYLWATNRYLRSAFGVAEAWGFKPSQIVVWCKPPVGLGPGYGPFASTTEFVLFARRGSLPYLKRLPSSWHIWPRGAHSVKPNAFLDAVEQISPPPYVELFARQPRLGWDSWGHGFEATA